MGNKNLTSRWIRFTAVFVGTTVIFATGLLALLIVPAVPDPTPGFAVRQGTLVAADETGREVLGDSTIIEWRLVSSSGLQVELAVRVPNAMDTPRPLVVLLGGVRTGHRAVRVTKHTPDIVVAALSYPFHGDPRAKGVDFIIQLPRIQRAFLDTPPAVMLAMDFLQRQPYVDPQYVELVGGSLGAFLVSVPGALDPRFRRVWLIHGAGNPREVFEYRLQQYIDSAPLRKLTARLLTIVTASGHLRAEKWVGRISPRPVIVVNARDDEAFPLSSVQSLHAALGEPKEVIWMEGAHVTPGRTDVVEQLVNLVVERVRKDWQTQRQSP